jgi:hypothetical protein
MFRVNEELAEGPIPGLCPCPERRCQNLPRVGVEIKRYFDVAAALAFFIVFAPLLLMVALGVWLTSPGPILFTQDRIGKRGRTFKFYKFRSMVQNSDEVFSSFLDSDVEARSEWETYQKLDRDPRVTWFGNFLRRSSLDELPQFWILERAEGRHEPGRPEALHAGSEEPVWTALVQLLRRAAGAYRAVAGEWAQLAHVRPARAPGSSIRQQLDVDVRSEHPCENGRSRADGARVAVTV